MGLAHTHPGSACRARFGTALDTYAFGVMPPQTAVHVLSTGAFCGPAPWGSIRSRVFYSTWSNKANPTTVPFWL